MTTQFEIGKKYYSQYNSGVITIVKRTAKFVTFTEEINGQSMKSMIINGNGEISEGKVIETRKSIKILNDSEYLSNGICSYYATNEIVEEAIETEQVKESKNTTDSFEQYEEDLQKLKGCFIEHSSSQEWKINQIWVRKTHVNENNQCHVSINAKCTLWTDRTYANKGCGVSATLTLSENMKFIKVEKRAKKEQTIKPPKLINGWITV